MTSPRLLQPMKTATLKRGRQKPESTAAVGFPMSGIVPVLAIVAVVCATGCGAADSDEFEVVDASHIASTPETTGSSDESSPPDTSGSATAASSDETTASSSNETPAGTDSTGSQTGSDTVAEEGSQASVNDTIPAAAGREGETTQPGDVVPGTSVAVIEPREIKLLVPEKTFRKEGREKALRVSYDDVDLLKVLNMEPVPENAPQLMPEWLKGLNGKQIRIRGFMYPCFVDSGIEIFLLARDNEICCFGRSPKVYDLIKVTMRDGLTTDYIQGRPFDVIGTFHIAEQAETEEGALPKLYRIENAIVVDR